MPTPNLGPTHDLSKRIADLEAAVRALAAPGLLPPSGIPVMPDPTQTGATVNLTATTTAGAFIAYFPYTHPYAAFAIWASVPLGTVATLTLQAGPMNGSTMTVNNSATWTLDGTSAAVQGSWFGGFPYAYQTNPAFDLGGTPADYGTVWGLALKASVNAGSVTVWPPCFTARFDQ